MQPESKSNRLRNWVMLGGLTLLLLILDQAAKWLVRQNLAVGEMWAPIPALSKIFTITHVQNTGVSFGQLAGWGWLFMLVNVGVLVGILIYYTHIPAEMWLLRLASPLIMASALGNMIDRLRTAAIYSQVTGSLWNALPHAYVTDFIDFKIWPVWNVADMCAVTGVAIVAYTLWTVEKAQTAEAAAVEATETAAGDD